VAVQDGIVTLTGRVAAGAAPGVAKVENHLTIAL